MGVLLLLIFFFFLCFVRFFFLESYVIRTDHMPVISVQCECTFEKKNVGQLKTRMKGGSRSCIPLNVKVGLFWTKFRIVNLKVPNGMSERPNSTISHFSRPGSGFH